VRWSELELAQAVKVAEDINSYRGARRIANGVSNIRLALSDATELRSGIWGSFPVVFMRQLYRELGFDENRIFKWRLEHKLVQALLLNHFAPGCGPATRALGVFRRAAGGCHLQAALETEFPSGFYLKPALGDSSGDSDTPDRTNQILAACAEDDGGNSCGRLFGERFLIQERVPIAREYRVHTLEDRLIPDLTFHRYEKGDIPGERDAPNAFVQGILDRLPNGVVAGTICGWDVARTVNSTLVVIEVNFSGFHPLHNRGFQCSGWFHDEKWGALSAARLVRFLEQRCGVKVSIEADRPDLETENEFYADVNRCRELLRDGAFT